MRDALSLLQAYPDRLISPLTPAAGPVVVGQSMVLGARYRHRVRSAPDKSSLIPIPPGVVWGERHCLGSEGELRIAVYVLVTTIMEIDDHPPPATQIRRSLSSPFVPVWRRIPDGRVTVSITNLRAPRLSLTASLPD